MIPKQLIRMENENTEEYCFRLMTDYKADPEKLRFCYTYTGKDGEKYFSKWISLFQLWHLAPEDKVPGQFDTRTQFFSKIQHRTILPCELTFDIDDARLGRKMVFPNIKSKAIFIKNQLIQKYNLDPIIYFTGNKSYHITCIIPKLLELDIQERQEYRSKMINNYGCDDLKKSESCPIALEGAIHYKSGKKKEVVEL